MKSYLFTCTALPRPELFARTIDSFKANLKGVDWKASTLIINVDPLPVNINTELRGLPLLEEYRRADTELSIQQDNTDKLLSIACKTFGRVIAKTWEEDLSTPERRRHIVNASDLQLPTKFPFRGNFPKAVQWVFDQASKMKDHEFVFHLEDDWEMVEENDIYLLATGIRASGMMQAALLPEGMETCHNQFVLCPSLICREAVEMAAAILKPEGGNPELQLRRFSPFRVNTYFVPPYGKPQVMDLGTAWRVEEGWAHNAVDFTTYALQEG